MAMTHRPEKALDALARELDATLAKIYGERMSFIMLISPFTEKEGRGDYISNARRDTAIEAMREFLALHDQMSMPTQGSKQ